MIQHSQHDGISNPKDKRISQGIMLASDSETSLEFASILAQNEVIIRAVILEPDTSAEMAEKIVGQFQITPIVVFTSRPDKDSEILELVASKEIDLLFCCWFKYRIRARLLDSLNVGAVNIHPSVLPHNKSRHSAFWGIMDETPLGATIHWMDESFDTGDIIGQTTFENDGLISADKVYEQQIALCVELFNEYLPRILKGNAPRVQQHERGSYHYERDIVTATRFNGSDTITMERLLRLARGTRIGSHGFYIRIGDREFQVSASVTEVT